MAGVAGTQIAGDGYYGFHKAGIFAGDLWTCKFRNIQPFSWNWNISRKAAGKNPDSSNNYDQYLFRVNYIELPVFYQYIVNKRLVIEAGPSCGFLVGYLEEKYGEEIKGGNRPANVTFQLNAGCMFIFQAILWSISGRIIPCWISAAIMRREIFKDFSWELRTV